MVSIRFGLTAALVTVSSLFGSTLAVPLADKLRSLTPGARDLLKRSVPAAPRFVAYHDQWVTPFPSASQLRGFSVYALSFLKTTGADDMALQWQQMSASERASYVQEYNSAGISLIVSAFGSTEKPTSSGTDPVAMANTIASWVLQHGVQGVDIEYEDFDAFSGGSGSAENWLVSLTRQLRTQLPQGAYILTHAPIAPWFSPHSWGGGGYLRVDSEVGSLIDWYNVQFYNQQPSEYVDCNGLVRTSSSAAPQSALLQILASGIPSDKLVLGKPAQSQDAYRGYMDPNTLATCISQAHSSGWGGGVAGWQYPHATPAWLSTVRGGTF